MYKEPLDFEGGKLANELWDKIVFPLHKNLVVCYSQFGNNPKYSDGWKRNYPLIEKYYGEPKVVMDESRIKYFNNELQGLSGYFWRFLFYDILPTFEYYLFRDLDSPITDREVETVNEWIKSGKTLHVMRDHPHHDWPMMGGMWGIKRVPGLNMTDLILDWVAKNPYPEYFGRKDKADGWMTDMFFLRDVIWPMFKDDCLQHDEMFGDKYGVTKPFPIKRNGLEYVGETIEADGSVSEEHRQILKNFLDGISNNSEL